jgi:3-hydroxyacyl-[acyl-carrier-protein] dehydratase
MIGNETPLWGMELVQELVPQRAPLLMVDSILRWDGEGSPIVHAARHIDLEEPVFAGHFPGQPVWPGVFTIEGLAQTCRILGTLERLAAECGRDEAKVSIHNLHRWLRGEQGSDSEAALLTKQQLSQMAGPGLLVAVELRLTRPVLPGSRLEYKATLQRTLDALVRFEVEASVRGETVARGALTTARPAG